ncbi:HNH endonuclease signature motif containing protein [Nodosilinea sp. E11]|uniref:HNH endonuclease signature motif containing protein n=1 Tax=Nodosilinea sp. E11 TaxID=3037479 RepID=UPI00293426F7|nr:HNH endonuclease signature motif containing protein [Nodosilinea sp. E11]WOD37387.1 HNH endonuclease signature motif containing protein [Nodosilinea sp. E11]WOD37949.1 HNH endonuclease signature motif containing protein [Nodosilinea sp. E11]
MPMDRSRYPENWEEIALQVKVAAGWRCSGCGRPCRVTGQGWEDFSDLALGYWAEDLDHPQRFTLTVAHLDQNPSNNDPSNLRALCAPCHLRHDAPYRKANSIAKRERAGQLPLLGGAIDG